MPKHNPKLDRPAKKKNKESYSREKDSYEDYRNNSPAYMVLIFVGLVLVVAVLFIFVFNNEGTRIEKYDTVRLDYDIYTYSAYTNHEDPFETHRNYWVNVCSRYDDTCETGGIIDGFYNELVGRRVGDTLNNKFIGKCIDADKNGYDDHSGGMALSYGFSNDTYFNTDLILWFHIKEINKSTLIEIDLDAAFICEENNRKHFEMSYYIIIVNRKNPLLLSI